MTSCATSRTCSDIRSHPGRGGDRGRNPAPVPSHNQFETERAFGAEFMRHKRERPDIAHRGNERDSRQGEAPA